MALAPLALLSVPVAVAAAPLALLRTPVAVALEPLALAAGAGRRGGDAVGVAQEAR